jgi:hypothetical protein
LNAPAMLSFMKNERERWAKTVKAIGIIPE